MTNHKIENLANPTRDTDATTKTYVDATVMNNKVNGSVFLKLDGSRKMAGSLDMDNKPIRNLPLPGGNYQPVTLIYGDRAYIKRDGSNTMNNNLNMNNKKINNLSTPSDNNDAANKKYVDDKFAINGGALGNYLKKDGTTPLTGNLNLNSKKIINLSTPT